MAKKISEKAKHVADVAATIEGLAKMGHRERLEKTLLALGATEEEVSTGNLYPAAERLGYDPSADITVGVFLAMGV